MFVLQCCGLRVNFPRACDVMMPTLQLLEGTDYCFWVFADAHAKFRQYTSEQAATFAVQFMALTRRFFLHLRRTPSLVMVCAGSLLSWCVRVPSCHGVYVFLLRVLVERIRSARNWRVRYMYGPDLHCNCVASAQTRIMSALMLSFVSGTLYYQMPLDQNGSENRVALAFMSLNYIFFSGWFLSTSLSTCAYACAHALYGISCVS